MLHIYNLPGTVFYLSIYRDMHVNNKLINIKCISRDAPGDDEPTGDELI